MQKIKVKLLKQASYRALPYMLNCFLHVIRKKILWIVIFI